jgi:DNA-binding CsgD family transcriptional regulator
VLSAVGEEIGRELTFGVALQLLEHRVLGASPEERERLFAGAARLAAPLFEVGSKQALYEGHPFSLLHGLYWLCANLSDEGPLLLTVDHAELADVPSLRFLFHLVQRLADLPMAVVLGTSYPRPAPQLALLEEIAQEPTTIALELPPLTPAAVADAIRQWLHPDADDDFCRACFEATGGNPLLLWELARDLSAGGVGGRAADAPRVRESAPSAIATAVLRRLEPLGPEALELARAVAVLGDGAEIDHAARLAHLDLAEVWRLADQLVRVDVLKADDRLTFAHPIVRRALHAERSAGERADAHLEAARILFDDGLPAERVAEQLLDARPGGGGWVVDVLMEAGRRARASGSTSVAARYLRRALEELSSPEEGAHILLELGHLEASTGDPRGLERLSQAMTLLDYPRLLAGAALSMGRLLYARGQPAEAATAFRRGAEALGDADERLLSQLRSGYTTAMRLANPASGELSDAASVADRDGGSAEERLLLAQAAFFAALRGERREAVRGTAMRAFGHGDLLREETPNGIGYYHAATALILAEELMAAEFALTAAIEEASGRGAVLGLATARYLRSLAILRRGRVEEAAADARQALAGEVEGWRLGPPAARAALAESLIQRGELEAAASQLRDDVEGGEEGGLPFPLFLSARGQLSLLRHAAERALDEFLECGRRLVEIGAGNCAFVGWRSGAALASSALGDRSGARRLAEEELRIAREAETPGALGRAMTGLGRVLGGEEGRGLLGEAVEILGGAQTVLFRAEALVQYGASVRRAGQRRAARESLAAGLDLAERLGARELAGRAREELLAAGARPRRTALRGVESLTPREKKVAELAAQGLSNRETADALFVTIKTVEWHLRHAYRKLGVSSRRELGAALARGSRPADR